MSSELKTFFEYLNETASRSVDENWLLYQQKLLGLINNYVPLVRIRGVMGKPCTLTYSKLAQKKKRLFSGKKTWYWPEMEVLQLPARVQQPSEAVKGKIFSPGRSQYHPYKSKKNFGQYSLQAEISCMTLP